MRWAFLIRKFSSIKTIQWEFYLLEQWSDLNQYMHTFYLLRHEIYAARVGIIWKNNKSRMKPLKIVIEFRMNERDTKKKAAKLPANKIQICCKQKFCKFKLGIPHRIATCLFILFCCLPLLDTPKIRKACEWARMWKTFRKGDEHHAHTNLKWKTHMRHRNESEMYTKML